MNKSVPSTLRVHVGQYKKRTVKPLNSFKNFRSMGCNRGTFLFLVYP